MTHDDDCPALAPGTRLVHIGLPKTGTTAIQFAASSQRSRLRARGVCYPGQGLNHAEPVAAMMRVSRRRRKVPMQYWHELADEVRSREWRAVWISQEKMADATAEHIDEFRDELGGPLHVVVTLRSFGAWLPSIWQQYVKTGYQGRFDDWLPLVLRDEPEQIAHKPFLFQRPSDVVERWGRVADQVTVIVLDKNRPQLLYSPFEQLLGLDAGTLHAEDTGGYRSNRGLSAVEAEFLRRVNEGFNPRENPPGSYMDLVRLGVVAGIQENRTPARSEPSVRLPEWAHEKVQQLGASEAQRLRGLGVAVVGNLDDLGRSGSVAADAVTSIATVPTVPIDLATEAMLGLYSQAAGHGLLFERRSWAAHHVIRREGREENGENARLSELSAPRIMLVILKRLLAHLGRKPRQGSNRKDPQ